MGLCLHDLSTTCHDPPHLPASGDIAKIRLPAFEIDEIRANDHGATTTADDGIGTGMRVPMTVQPEVGAGVGVERGTGVLSSLVNLVRDGLGLLRRDRSLPPLDCLPDYRPNPVHRRRLGRDHLHHLHSDDVRLRRPLSDDARPHLCR